MDHRNADRPKIATRIASSKGVYFDLLIDSEGNLIDEAPIPADPGAFTDWLRGQSGQDGPVGDLARDFVESGMTDAMDLEQVTRGFAYEAFRAALRQYADVSVFS